VASPDPDRDESLRREFLGWQCRIRQLSARHAGGRPTSGMRPSVLLPSGESLGRITVLIMKLEPEPITAQFKHMVRRTHDPAERYENALEVLAAAYYQRPLEFADEMTALFGPGSATVRALLEHRACTLEFEQYNQRYELACAVGGLDGEHPAFQFTFWHNSLFNPEMPPEVAVLCFKPDWSTLRSDPDPQET
jgi:hypothetical protein